MFRFTVFCRKQKFCRKTRTFCALFRKTYIILSIPDINFKIWNALFVRHLCTIPGSWKLVRKCQGCGADHFAHGRGRDKTRVYKRKIARSCCWCSGCFSATDIQSQIWNKSDKIYMTDFQFQNLDSVGRRPSCRAHPAARSAETLTWATESKPVRFDEVESPE